MSHKRDVIGKKFNRLTVLDEDLEKSKQMGRRYVKCCCDCGNIISIASWRLGNNKCNSCGCYRNEQVKKAKFKKRIRNEIFIKNNIAYIKLRKSNNFAFIDKEDLDKVKNYTWRETKDGYPICYYNENGKQSHKCLHNVFINPPRPFEVDHINQNKLDNRKSNLRVVTHLENMHNINRVAKSNTGVSNVYKVKSGKFAVRIQYNLKQNHIGTFNSMEEAKIALEDFKKEKLDCTRIDEIY